MVHIACSDAPDIVIDLHESKTHAIADTDCICVCGGGGGEDRRMLAGEG